jgi:hypothetical protein
LSSAGGEDQAVAEVRGPARRHRLGDRRRVGVEAGDEHAVVRERRGQVDAAARVRERRDLPDRRARRPDLDGGRGDRDLAQRQDVLDERPDEHEVVVVAVRVEDLDDLALAVLPRPERDAHRDAEVLVFEVGPAGAALALQRVREQPDEGVVRRVGGRHRQAELPLGGRERRVRVVDDDDAQVEHLAAGAGHSEHGPSVDELLQRHDQDRVAVGERLVAGVGRRPKAEPVGLGDGLRDQVAVRRDVDGRAGLLVEGALAGQEPYDGLAAAGVLPNDQVPLVAPAEPPFEDLALLVPQVRSGPRRQRGVDVARVEVAGRGPVAESVEVKRHACLQVQGGGASAAGQAAAVACARLAALQGSTPGAASSLGACGVSPQLRSCSRYGAPYLCKPAGRGSSRRETRLRLRRVALAGARAVRLDVDVATRHPRRRVAAWRVPAAQSTGKLFVRTPDALRCGWRSGGRDDARTLFPRCSRRVRRHLACLPVGGRRQHRRMDGMAGRTDGTAPRQGGLPQPELRGNRYLQREQGMNRR